MTPLRVLLVDDLEEFRENVAEVLGARGVEVSHASGGAEALALLVGDPLPHLVLLDLWMPGVDGHAVLRAMRADPRLALIPVIVLTASDLDAERVGAPYLVKPFGVEDVLTLIATVLRQGPQPGADLWP